MKAMDATFTNGRYEFPPHARGVLVLAHPPEAGWRMQTPSDEQSAAECDPLVGSGRRCDRQLACDGAPA